MAHKKFSFAKESERKGRGGRKKNVTQTANNNRSNDWVLLHGASLTCGATTGSPGSSKATDVVDIIFSNLFNGIFRAYEFVRELKIKNIMYRFKRCKNGCCRCSCALVQRKCAPIVLCNDGGKFNDIMKIFLS